MGPIQSGINNAVSGIVIAQGMKGMQDVAEKVKTSDLNISPKALNATPQGPQQPTNAPVDNKTGLSVGAGLNGNMGPINPFDANKAKQAMQSVKDQTQVKQNIAKFKDIIGELNNG